MRTLARSASVSRSEAGGFMPPVLLPLEAMNIKARQGTTTAIAGPAGSLKTGLALYLVLRWGRPTWYLSADAEAFEMVERAAAQISGDTISQVRQDMGKYGEVLAEHASHLKLCFEDSPTYEDIELELTAYVEVLGYAPEVIVIDNLMNIVGQNEDEWSSMRDSMRFIHRLARATGATVLVLHHMADDRKDTTTPAPRSSFQGKVSQLFKAIWSLAVDGETLKVAPVKNRWGRQDTSGNTFATIWVDPERGRFYNTKADLHIGRAA